jgi:hypothetical protein
MSSLKCKKCNMAFEDKRRLENHKKHMKEIKSVGIW